MELQVLSFICVMSLLGCVIYLFITHVHMKKNIQLLDEREAADYNSLNALLSESVNVLNERIDTTTSDLTKLMEQKIDQSANGVIKLMNKELDKKMDKYLYDNE